MTDTTLWLIIALAVACVVVCLVGWWLVHRDADTPWWAPVIQWGGLIGGVVAIGMAIGYRIAGRRRTPSGSSDDAPDQDDTRHPLDIHPEPYDSGASAADHTLEEAHETVDDMPDSDLDAAAAAYDERTADRRE